jgi:hypothetical protein
MKERNIYSEDFERQLKEKADQFKMYPSDRIWNEVHNSLHTRKRRFVLGMSFLIGGILFLAGTQLISPPRISSSKLIAEKIKTKPKPATAADLHQFTPGGFSSVVQGNTANLRNAGDNVNALASFLLRGGPSTEKKSGLDIQDLPDEKIQNTVGLKPIQEPEQKVSGKSVAPVTATGVKDDAQSMVINPVINNVSADVIPEKSVSQLTRIHDDRFSWEIYITPTRNTHYLYGLDYRTMTQNVSTSPIMVVHIANVNGFVDNTPVLGYDVGGNILYRISKNISLKAGLEFSFSRYYIRTYNSNQGQPSATLNSYLGYVVDSLAYSSAGGGSIDKNPEHFQNRYYQLSVPIGVEMKVAEKGKFQLHLGASLQPSYLLNTDAYVLTNDFNSYTKNADAFRRWNLIAGAEAFISYGVGKIRWELGPQVRYQIFSTYKNSYPLQENMLNYGIRIGIAKSIW